MNASTPTELARAQLQAIEPVAESADALRDLLRGPARHLELSLDELALIGRVFYDDPEGLALYGLTPSQYVSRGVKLLGRTAVECKTDGHLAPLPSLLSDLVSDAVVVIDPYAGSGNMLWHVASAVGAATAVGFEFDAAVQRVTTENLRRLDARHVIYSGRFESCEDNLVGPHTQALVVIDPPWGSGYSFERGLDLRRTDPPVIEIVRQAAARLPGPPAPLFVIATSEHLDERSLDTLVAETTILRRAASDHLGARRNVGYLVCRGASHASIA